MIAERDFLMTHTWPELRRLCQERFIELVEVDLRWGIPEEQSTRKETLKLCLDEIRAKLKREGHFHVDSHLAGRKIRDDLRKVIDRHA